jgi:hypothetical protein
MDALVRKGAIVTTWRIVMVVGLGAVLTWLVPGQAGAQQAYRPASPVFSPWLNLYQRNTGALDNYHTYVRPQMDLRNTLRQQETVNQRQAAGINRLSQRVNEMQTAQDQPMRATGTGSVFGNTSHYFGQGATAQAVTRPRGDRRTWTPKPPSTGNMTR